MSSHPTISSEYVECSVDLSKPAINCPICLDDIKTDMVAHHAIGNATYWHHVHKDCLQRWVFQAGDPVNKTIICPSCNELCKYADHSEIVFTNVDLVPQRTALHMTNLYLAAEREMIIDDRISQKEVELIGLRNKVSEFKAELRNRGNNPEQILENINQLLGELEQIPSYDESQIILELFSKITDLQNSLKQILEMAESLYLVRTTLNANNREFKLNELKNFRNLVNNEEEYLRSNGQNPDQVRADITQLIVEVEQISSDEFQRIPYDGNSRNTIHLRIENCLYKSPAVVLLSDKMMKEFARNETRNLHNKVIALGEKLHSRGYNPQQILARIHQLQTELEQTPSANLGLFYLRVHQFKEELEPILAIEPNPTENLRVVQVQNANAPFSFKKWAVPAMVAIAALGTAFYTCYVNSNQDQ